MSSAKLARSGSDTARVRATYRRYDRSPRIQRRRDPANPGTRAMMEERSEALRTLLRALQLPAEPVIVDIGCGGGALLREVADELVELSPVLYGLDLLEDRIQTARHVVPEARTWVQSAAALPFADGSVDLVLCFTLLSSVLDQSVARQIAHEMWRVLAPDGVAIVYDMRYLNPHNRSVRPLNRRRLRRLFPAAELHMEPLTLLPPIARILASHTSTLYPRLARFDVLRGHYLSSLGRTATRAPHR